jgi:hypothetical protein
MTELARNLFSDVDVVGELQRLVVLRPAVEEVVHGVSHGRPRGREHARRLTRQRVRHLEIGIRQRGGLNVLAADTCGKRRKAHRQNPDEAEMLSQGEAPA